MAEYGSRGPNEWDTAFDTWETDPALTLTLIDRMRHTDASHAPDAQHDRLATERVALEAEVLGRLRWPLCRLFARVLRSARFHILQRERAKTTIVRAIHGARLGAQELDRRLSERSGGRRGDLWYLVDTELDAYVADPAAFADTITERRRVHSELAARMPSSRALASVTGSLAWRVASAWPGDGRESCCTPAIQWAWNRVTCSSPRSPIRVGPRSSYPADAVVVDVGAPMSHAVIVSRELGIPCAISVTDATRRIPDGAMIEVDGGAGTVTILELPHSRVE